MRRNEKGLTWGRLITGISAIITLLTAAFYFGTSMKTTIGECFLASVLLTVVGGTILIFVITVILVVITVLRKHWNDEILD